MGQKGSGGVGSGGVGQKGSGGVVEKGSGGVDSSRPYSSTPLPPTPLPPYSSTPLISTPPLHIIGARLSLETRPPSGRPRLSAHALVQEYLNRTDHLWAIVTNGLRWRLLRDSSLMTRLTYVEFDLEQILNGENFAEFGLFYRLFHRSRLPEGMEDADDCLLEFYHQESLQQGGRVRDRLRDGVEKALTLLGTGFLHHPRSQVLREQIQTGQLSAPDFYRSLLLIIYRLLFLMVAEARNLLFVRGDGGSGGVGGSSGVGGSGGVGDGSIPLPSHFPTSLPNQRIYQEYYSLDRLRLLAERPIGNREGFHDVWQGLRVTFLLFDENWRGQALGLSPLNGDLFGSQHLEPLQDWAIDNADLLQAIRYLSLYEQKGQLRRINYAALDVEELGSVYESLLDFYPQVTQQDGIYQFQLVTGSDRKTTGSYYTPPELVGQLIKSALEPVIEERLRGAVQRSGGGGGVDASSTPLPPYSSTPPISLKEQALLSLKVCDPACGSGHFLLAAARRIGKELARVRTGEMQPGPDALRLAVRDVVQNCIYGVDLNPLAVDLCKVALWIEGFAAGMPLNFLDHRIKCGNSLVGVFDLEVLREGIPDGAYTAVTGDDKKLASSRKKDNKEERKGQRSLFEKADFESDRSQFAQLWQEMGAIPEQTPEQIRQKQAQYQASRENAQWWNDRTACNLWTAAFFTPITAEGLALVPTTAALARVLDEASRYPDRYVGVGGVVERGSGGVGSSQSSGVVEKGSGGVGSSLPTTSLPPYSSTPLSSIVEAANRLAEELRFFHWPLEFPEVFDQGGFDCILGNPPWEQLQFDPREFFATRKPEVANAKNMAARNKMIENLKKDAPELFFQYENGKHSIDCIQKFIHDSDRFPLTSYGRINLAPLFCELSRKLLAEYGFASIITPIGIATDSFNQYFFGDLINKQSLSKLIGFENEAFIFSEVHHAFKFCILSVVGSSLKIEAADLIFFCRYFKQIEEHQRHFKLYTQDIQLINANTLTCPIFRTSVDANLTRKIYEKVPIIENEKTGENPWGISFMLMFMMNTDSGLFHNEPSAGQLPLYEAKMFHQFDHRFSTYEGATQANLNAGILPQATAEMKQDFNFAVMPRYWVDRSEVENRLADKWDRKWLLGWRDVTNSVSQRTVISSLFPLAGCGDTALLMLPDPKFIKIIGCLYVNLNVFVFDFVARQKVGGNHLKFFTMKQLPVIPPETYTQADINFIAPRVLELTYTAWDIKPFADDLWSSAVEEWFKGGVGEEGSSGVEQNPPHHSTTPLLPLSKVGEKGSSGVDLGGIDSSHSSTPLPHHSSTPLLHHILTQWQANHDTTIQQLLSRTEDLAGGDELSRYVLSTYAKISQGRAVWNDFPDSEGWSIYTRQHRRGLRQGEQGGLHSISSDCPGIPQGTGNPSDSMSTSQPSSPRSDSTLATTVRENRENVESVHSVSAKQLVLSGVVEEGNSEVGEEENSGIDSTPPLPYSPTLPLPPFIWNEDRRAILRAELDAYYAKLYGLTRDELRYILDPADVYGPDFPSETFRVLKNNEIKKYGEYRTQRLVLEAWDKLGF